MISGLLAAVLCSSAAAWAQTGTDTQAAPAAQSAPGAAPVQAAPPENQTLTPDQVPNMPAYRGKKAKKQAAAPPVSSSSGPAHTAAPAAIPTTDPPAQAATPDGAPQPAAAPTAAEPAVSATQPDTVGNHPAAEPQVTQDLQMEQTQPPPVPPALLPQGSPEPPPSEQTAHNPPVKAMPPYAPAPDAVISDQLGSTYIQVDNWIYPALLRLYSLGYLDSAFLDQRPWTRRSVMHMLSYTSAKLDAEAADDSEARDIYEAVRNEISGEADRDQNRTVLSTAFESSYTRLLGITSDPLVPQYSYFFGQTINNDYGRPYAAGFNSVAGASARAEYGRFSAYFRGEYQHAPGYYALSPAQASYFYNLTYFEYPVLPTATLPIGPQNDVNPFRVLEADVAFHLSGHEISFGKHDAWLSPDYGGSLAWSNNAEPIYSFQINRVEPLRIPFISRFLGPIRYQFFYGDLKGHFYPRHPYVHSEKFTFKPSANFEFGFQRTIIFGGAGHQSVTLGHFLHGFFNADDTNAQSKCVLGESNTTPQTCEDPGARFSSFDFSYRVPYLRKYLTIYTDSFDHDDPSPVGAPARASIRPGLYLSQIPGLPKVDFRVEGVSTDPPGAQEPVGFINSGEFVYYETIQREGYTNKGVILGDAVGRQGKGGGAWLTYHLSPQEMLQFSYRNNKESASFIPGGTTQNEFRGTVVKRLGRDLELNGWVQYESWKAPYLRPGAQSDTSIAAQFTWYPKDKKLQ